MKRYFLFLILILFCFGCKEVSSPAAPILPGSAADVILDGNMLRYNNQYGFPQFTGYLKNIGTDPAYNPVIEIKCYSDAAKASIIDVAVGVPANTYSLQPNQRAWFAAVAYRLTSHSQIQAFDYNIWWSNRKKYN
jgi:hypothetical protein